MTGPLTVRAPGKLILLGEYAVLEGAPCLVAAVDRHAVCTVHPPVSDRPRIEAAGLGHAFDVGDRPPAGPDPLAFARAAVAAWAERTPVPPGTYRLDSEALAHRTDAGQRFKLGLGGSAATTVALLGALHAGAGRPPEAHAPAIYRLAQAVHHAVQGGGSGADVAASALGGLLAYRWLAPAAPPTPSETVPSEPASASFGGDVASPDAAPPSGDDDAAAARRPGSAGAGTLRLPTPAGVGVAERLELDRLARIRAVWTGRSASTPALVERVLALRTTAPRRYAAAIDALTEAARAGIAALRAGARPDLLAAAAETARALRALGDAAGAPLVTPAHDALAAVARPFGAVVKPTGAGGGDLAWLLAPDEDAERAAAAALRAAGHPVLDLALSPRGVHRA